MSKLPREILLHLELQQTHSVTWTVAHIRSLLDKYIKARDAAEHQIQTVCTSTKLKEVVPSASLSDVHYPRIPSSGAALIASNKNSRQPIYGCHFCGESHWSDDCNNYTTVEARKQQIKGKCFKCLRGGHAFKNCIYDRICFHCQQKGNHHRSLCPRKFPSAKTESAQVSNETPYLADYNTYQSAELGSTEQTLLVVEQSVFMQTATTIVKKNSTTDSQRKVRLLLDSGSQRTYITEELAHKLNLKVENRQEEINIVTFGSDKAQKIKTSSTTLEIQLKDGTFLSITANVVPKITGTLHRMPIPLESWSNWNVLWKNITLADSLPTKYESSDLHILIGNDFYLDLILPRKIELSKGLYLLDSRLGWILSGRTTAPSARQPELSFLLLTLNKNIHEDPSFLLPHDSYLPLKPNLEEFWALETIGIRDAAIETSDDNAITNFNETLMFTGDRYFVTWPWKNKDNPNLPDNYGLSLGRLKSLIQKFKRNTDLFQRYGEIIKEQENKGIIERVTANTSEGIHKHYVPHHAVITPTKTTTKIRIVYDASAKFCKTNNSLNQCLHRGPVLLHNLCGLLLRFRVFPIAVVADIEKAFLQVGLQPMDRDVTRFLWLQNPSLPTTENNIQVYRFCRVPFGVVSSPFLLAATVNYHVQKFGTTVAKTIAKNMYVDNLLTGFDTTEEACNFYQESKVIFHGASMNLREWATNSDSVSRQIPDHDLDKRKDLNVLGISWNTKADTFTICSPDLNEDSKRSKREVLRYIASVFDPLGFFSPVILPSKLFLQELWLDKFDWDSTLPKHRQNECILILSEIAKIMNFPIPRYVGLLNSKREKSYQLHCFCDSSTKAYAAAVYLRTSDEEDNVVAKLIFSKNRLAPTKPITIPRLELLAVLIGVRAIAFVEKELQLPSVEKIIWTDSQCVLCWIESNNHLPQFVENRLKEIKSQHGTQFRYIPSQENPADVATRGSTVDKLETKSWWQGPQWLTQSSKFWPTWHPPLETSEKEIKSKPLYEAKLIANQQTDICDTPFQLNPSNFSSLTRLLRVTAWMQRFVDRLRKKSYYKGPLAAKEVFKASQLWVKSVQFCHFRKIINAIQQGTPCSIKRQLGLQLDEDNVIRCHGRLKNSDLLSGAITPILLPKSDPFTLLVIQKYHKVLLHSGTSQTLAQVRHEFWIPQGRSVVRRVLHDCKVCMRAEGGPYKMPAMPPLPKERVSQSLPFSYTGLDYLGPLYIKSKTEINKVWICLFTCMAVRAIHLEIVTDMSASSFLLCLRRFVARRGIPTQITSDNATQFKLAKTVLELMWQNAILSSDVKDYSCDKGITWKFITELSPWMGGLYERLVGIVKRCLRKSIGKSLLTYDQLQTFIQEVETVVNKRPLVYVDDDINSNIAISPSDFLSFNQKIFPLFEDDTTDPDYKSCSMSAEKLLQIWKKGQRILDTFWNTWKNEYLTSLRERTQTHLKGPRYQSSYVPKRGDVVLLKEDLPRSTWRIGKIKDLIPSRDGSTRSANVLLPSRQTLNRPLCLLYPIECPCNLEDRRKESSKEGPVHQVTPDRQRPSTRVAAMKARTAIYKQLN